MRGILTSTVMLALAATGLAQEEKAVERVETAPQGEVPAQPELSEEELMSMTRDARCGQVLITCLINGQPMRMMLDTGATHSVLHGESAAALQGVEWVDTSRMKFRGNSSQHPKLLLAALQAGPAIAPRHAFMVVSLAAVRGMMAEKIDGILGMDVLGSLPFTFDGRTNQYYWGVPEGAVLLPLAGRRDENGRLFVKVKLQDTPMELLLDTGSSVTRVYADEWSPGAAAEIKASMGNVDKAASMKVKEGKPADLELAPGKVLRSVKPIFCERNDRSMLGMDVLSEVVLIHLPTQDSPYGAFFVER